MSFIIYGWSDFYKHSIYGMSHYSDNYFNLNPNYYIGYSSQSQWDNQFLKDGIDFDENTYGLFIKGNSVELKIGNYSPRFGPFLSSNLLLSGQYPAFSNIHFKINSNKFEYHLLCGDLESNILTNLDDRDSFFHPRTIYYHRIDAYFKANLRVGIFESIISGHNRIDLSYLNPLSFYWSSQHTKADKDNLFMGFDWEYIISSWRVYGAFIMDEWSPTRTFYSNNHNWFGAQIGLTKIINLYNITSSVKLEYSAISPNVYSHDLQRNLPQHHEYNLGYWSGGNSENMSMYLTSIISDELLIYMHVLKNYKGISGYRISNVMNANLWDKTNFTIGVDYLIISNLGLNISYNIISSSNLYNGQIKGFDFSLKYNIDY